MDGATFFTMCNGFTFNSTTKLQQDFFPAKKVEEKFAWLVKKRFLCKRFYMESRYN